MCSERGFISELLCMKTVAVVANAVELRAPSQKSHFGVMLADRVSGPRYATS